MFEKLRSGETVTCDGPNCERPLEAEPTLVFTTDAGERRAYECSCGALTITVARDASSSYVI